MVFLKRKEVDTANLEPGTSHELLSINHADYYPATAPGTFKIFIDKPINEIKAEAKEQRGSSLDPPKNPEAAENSRFKQLQKEVSEHQIFEETKL